MNERSDMNGTCQSACSPLLRRIDDMLAAVDRAYDCVFEHGRDGLSSIDNLRRIANDVRLCAENRG
jgi:hypothetical protein